METHLMSAELKHYLPSNINLSGIVFRDGREMPTRDEQPPCDPDLPVPPSDTDFPADGDREPPSYSDLGGDETKDDYYPYPEAPYPQGHSSGD